MNRHLGRAFRATAGATVLLGVGSCNLAALEAAPPEAQAADAAPPSGKADAQLASVIVLSGELEQGGWARGQAPSGTVSLTFDGNAIPIARDGAFFIAFDRDAGTSASLVATLADGRTVRRELAVAPRDWNIERLNIPMKPGKMPSEEFLRIRKDELAEINAARALRTGADGWRQTFIWPVKGRISGRFGSQRIYQGVAGSYHSGIDIATGTSGTPIVAPADGVVILAAAAPFTLEGHLLMIDHGMGLNSAFLHCSELEVKVGDHVKQGQFIARIGMTGRATGPHLHWSIKWDAARLDPLLFAGRMP